MLLSEKATDIQAEIVEMEIMPDLRISFKMAYNSTNCSIIAQKGVGGTIPMFWRRVPESPCALKMIRMNDMLEKLNFATYQQRIVQLTVDSPAKPKIHGLELLNRPLKNPDFMNPEQFYSFAATHGKSSEVDVLTMKTALQRWTSILDSQQTPSDVSLFVNLHLSTLFSTDWTTLLPSLPVDPSSIVLELSEREGLDTYSKEDIYTKIRELQQLGFQIAVDDLGMGYSGLYTLAMVHPDYVKIDRQLVQGIDHDPYRQHMMHALVTYWKQEQVSVIAEGIEREQEARFFFDIGTDLAQGYYYHRPSEVSTMTDAVLIPQLS